MGNTNPDGEPSQADKHIERDRYDRRASAQLAGRLANDPQGYADIPAALRAPYLHYAETILAQAHVRARVLEIGAGTGAHTGYLLERGAWVTATDISAESLRVLRQRHESPEATLDVCTADMEAIPFSTASFDMVTAAGCLSYGDTLRVLSEIERVLRPGGVFVCVDSLNDNPVYRFNRWLHYLRGGRSKSTLRRMPSTRTLDLYSSRFESVQVRYFGALTFALPLLRRILREDKCARLLDRFDHFVGVRRSAFKFVMVARKFGQSYSDELRD